MNLKESLLSLALTGISLISGCRTPTQEYLARTTTPDPFRWELLNAIPPKDEEGIKRFLNNITYGREKEETWMSPKVSVTKGYGDCDCRGFLGAYLAGKIDYPRKIIAVARENASGFCGRGHVFTFLERQESGKTKYGLLDNSLLLPPEFDSPNSLIKAVNEDYKRTEPRHKDWNCYKIIDIDSSFPEDWVTTEKDLYNETIVSGGYVRVE